MKSSTEILIKALRILDEEIQSPGGVANTAISEAVNRLEELQEEVERLRAVLEDKTSYDSVDGNRVLASDAYFEIADIVLGDNGGSVIDAVTLLKQERDQLKVQVERLKTGRKWITYCPEDGVENHNSEDDALKYGHELIEAWLDPDFGWDDDVKKVFVAQITHRAGMVDRVDRPPEDELDENGCDHSGDDWSDPDITCKCNYRLIPVDNCQVEK